MWTVRGIYGPRRRDRQKSNYANYTCRGGSTNSEAVRNQFGVHKSTVKKYVYIFCKRMMNGPIRDLIWLPGEEEASEIARDDVEAK